MSGFRVLCIVLLAAMVADASALTRKERSYTFFELSGSATSPVGDYTRIGVIDFLDAANFPRALDADEVWDNGFSIGLAAGRLTGNNFAASIGIRFTRATTPDAGRFRFDDGSTVSFEDYAVPGPVVGDTVFYSWVPEVPTFNVWDLELNLAWYLLSPTQSPIAPWFGAGGQVGLLAQTLDGFESEYYVSTGINLNAGVEFVFGRSPRGAWSVSPQVSWNAVATNDRPQYLHIGAAVRYWGLY